MNNARRKEIEEIRAALENAKADLEGFVSNAEQARDDEEDAFGNMPESIQQGERGQASEAAAEALSTMCDSLAEAIDALDSAIESANEAIQQ